MTAQEITIRNEAEAFDLLEKALRSELHDTAFNLKFVEWPNIEIVLSGPGYDSSITAEMAEALVKLQTSLNRAYAKTVHASSNARSLTSEEKNALRFKAKVRSGSSAININLSDIATKFVEGAVAKMTPQDLVLTIVGVTLIAAGTYAYKLFLQHKSSDKQIEQEARTRLSLSQEETRRSQIMADALTRVPRLSAIREEFDEARSEILNATADAESIRMNSVLVDSATAKVIASRHRAQAIDVQLNGNYLVQLVDFRQVDEIRLRIQSVENGREFIASFRDQSLNQDQLGILQKAEWERSKVYLSVNAKILRDEITSATVISVTPQQE